MGNPPFNVVHPSIEVPFVKISHPEGLTPKEIERILENHESFHMNIYHTGKSNVERINLGILTNEQTEDEKYKYYVISNISNIVIEESGKKNPYQAPAWNALSVAIDKKKNKKIEFSDLQVTISGNTEFIKIALKIQEIFLDVIKNHIEDIIDVMPSGFAKRLEERKRKYIEQGNENLAQILWESPLSTDLESLDITKCPITDRYFNKEKQDVELLKNPKMQLRIPLDETKKKLKNAKILAMTPDNQRIFLDRIEDIIDFIRDKSTRVYIPHLMVNLQYTLSQFGCNFSCKTYQKNIMLLAKENNFGDLSFEKQFEEFGIDEISQATTSQASTSQATQEENFEDEFDID